MPSIMDRTGGEGVSTGDIIIVLLISMAWFFLVQVSSSFVVVAMSGVAWFMVAIYIISRFTGFLSYMRLSKPTWTISYLISIPIWMLLFSVLPAQKLPSAITEGSKYILDQIIPPQVLDWMVNSLFFGITESLLIVFLVAFFIGIAVKKSGKMNIGNSKGELAAIIFVAAFSALLHTGVALLSASSGNFNLTTVLIHQLVAFFIMIILGMFFGAPGIIAPHIAKNDLVYSAVGLWWVSLLICIIIDLTALFAGGKGGAKRQIKDTVGRFT